MIISLISAGLGMLGGVIPDIMREVRESREHGRELERLDKQGEMQIKLLQHQSETRLAEIEGQAGIEEMRAFRTQMSEIYKSQAPIGVKWVDAWNAALRPFACTIIIILFTAIASTYAYGMYFGAAHLAEVSLAIWGSLVGEAVQAVLGYLFGYRAAAKLSAGRAR